MKGKYEEAIKYYDKSLETDPEYTNALNNKGIALGELGRFEEAIECYDKALEIDPGFEEGRKAKDKLLDLMKNN